MAKLIHKNKTILNEMKYVDSILDIGKGLMFASRKKVEKGMCLVFPTKKNRKFECSITMLFCFSSYEVLFVDKDFKVVDKAVLPPFKLSYIPKKACKYVIESTPNRFKDIRIGDKIKIKK